MATKNTITWSEKADQMLFFSLLALSIFVAFKLGSYVSDIVISFIAALIINYVLAGPVKFLTKYIKIRAISILVILSGFIALSILVGSMLFPSLISQLKALKGLLPELIPYLQALMIKINQSIAAIDIKLPEELYTVMNDFNKTTIIKSLGKTINIIDYANFSAFLGSVLLKSATIIAYTILVIVLSFYLLLDGDKIWNTFLKFFAKKFTKHIEEVKERIDKSLNAYIAGQLQIASLTAIVMLVTYLLLQNKYALLLGSAQMLEFIPLVGTWIAIIPCIAIVFFTSGPIKAMIAVIVYLSYTQVVRDYFIAPRVLGTALNIHPIFLILSLVFAAKTGGAAGILLCLPILAVINGVWSYIRTLYV